jgi:adenine C2-methylase RlmN of 23S rRNA A2503 and tRNA A37
VAKGIRQLGDDKVKFKLALSLHAANDQKRHELMPINDTNNIRSLVDALNYFYKQTKNEITFEYILFKNFNDSLKEPRTDQDLPSGTKDLTSLNITSLISPNFPNPMKRK